MADDEYLETRVMTAPSHHLHLMVIDGAIRFAKQAEQAFEDQDYETAHFALSSSRDFVGELIGGLDSTRFPELVDRLKDLFVFVYRNLIKADLERNGNLVRDALHVLQLHRETWVALSEKRKQEQISEKQI